MTVVVVVVVDVWLACRNLVHRLILHEAEMQIWSPRTFATFAVQAIVYSR